MQLNIFNTSSPRKMRAPAGNTYFAWLTPDGLLHREDGPARIHEPDVEEWFYLGRAFFIVAMNQNENGEWVRRGVLAEGLERYAKEISRDLGQTIHRTDGWGPETMYEFREADGNINLFGRRLLDWLYKKNLLMNLDITGS